MHENHGFINVCWLSHVVARGFGPHRVFSCQGDTAHGDDQQDTHLKISQGADVVTRPPKPRRGQRQINFSRSRSLHLSQFNMFAFKL